VARYACRLGLRRPPRHPSTPTGADAFSPTPATPVFWVRQMQHRRAGAGVNIGARPSSETVARLLRHRRATQPVRRGYVIPAFPSSHQAIRYNDTYQSNRRWTKTFCPRRIATRTRRHRAPPTCRRALGQVSVVPPRRVSSAAILRLVRLVAVGPRNKEPPIQPATIDSRHAGLAAQQHHVQFASGIPDCRESRGPGRPPLPALRLSSRRPSRFVPASCPTLFSELPPSLPLIALSARNEVAGSCAVARLRASRRSGGRVLLIATFFFPTAPFPNFRRPRSFLPSAPSPLSPRPSPAPVFRAARP